MTGPYDLSIEENRNALRYTGAVEALWGAGYLEAILLCPIEQNMTYAIEISSGSSTQRVASTGGGWITHPSIGQSAPYSNTKGFEPSCGCCAIV